MTADPTSPNCCAPSRPEGASSRPPPQSMGSGAHRAALCPIPGGAGLMGTNRPVIKLDGEATEGESLDSQIMKAIIKKST